MGGMTYEYFQLLLRNRPFLPFVVHLSNGESPQIRYPEVATLTRTRLVIVDPEADRITVSLFYTSPAWKCLSGGRLTGRPNFRRFAGVSVAISFDLTRLASIRSKAAFARTRTMTMAVHSPPNPRKPEWTIAFSELLRSFAGQGPACFLDAAVASGCAECGTAIQPPLLAFQGRNCRWACPVSAPFLSGAWPFSRFRASFGPFPDRSKARLDRHGDSLPPGAIARLGDESFRATYSDFALSPDGKTLAIGGLGRNPAVPCSAG